MRNIYVIIPAINEEESIAKVIADIPDFVKEIIVVDNGSEDSTAEVAGNSGATVLVEPELGYGAACLKGIEHVKATAKDNDIIVFLDGDYSDYPQEMESLIRPIQNENIEMVIGSRILGKSMGMTEKGSLLPQAEFGNWLSTALIRMLWGYEFTDLGPFRAIEMKALSRMKMSDRNYGWTVEMQIKAAKLRMKCKEIPTSYRKRIGYSKVTGTVSGSVKAGYKILATIFRYALR